MGKEMNLPFCFAADWESLAEGEEEERACFAALSIRYGDVWLSEGHDLFVNRVRPGPLISAYHLAEWIVWNWWRLRWEPRKQLSSWELAHRLSTVGYGYAWPNITIFSDGERIAIVARPTSGNTETAFRYISDSAAVLTAKEFESAIDQFVLQVLGQLAAEGVKNSNLESLWSDLTRERQDTRLRRRRKLEALMGFDPDEADEAVLEGLVQDGKILGESAVEEIAADHHGGAVASAKELADIATRLGFDASPQDAIKVDVSNVMRNMSSAPAWLVGARAARLVREQLQRPDGMISNSQLAAIAGVDSDALKPRMGTASFAFALNRDSRRGRVVLRGRRPTARRFEIARLLGDYILTPGQARLYPATRSHTYRQKMQRSFAAELLSPFEPLDEYLAGDYSEERQEDAAGHFNVSPLTVRTLLVNHGRLDRTELEQPTEALLDVA
jgi:hypothetical protein